MIVMLPQIRKPAMKELSLLMKCRLIEIAKYVGSYVAAMNGVDAIVFTGGIGENGFWLRSKVCSYLGYLGVNINESVNQKTVKGAEAELTNKSDKVRVFILATNEELMIARDTKEIVDSL